MRLFDDTVTMIEEIRRDVTKSPVMTSSRVQADNLILKAKEALNYSYGIRAEAMPEDHYELAKLGNSYFGDEGSWSDIPQIVAWLAVEHQKRFQPLSKTSRYGDDSENYHPELTDHREGHHYGYTYRERLIGFLPAMESILLKDLYSRRAYWPVFEQRDSHRGSDFTRVPCTLGYHFAVRDIELSGPLLQVTIMQRSCHFSRFWLSDLWFGHCAQKLIAERIEIPCGLIVHNIVSLHDFITEEIY